MTAVQLGALLMLASAAVVGGLIIAVGVYVTIAAAIAVAVTIAIVMVELFVVLMLNAIRARR